MLAANESRNDSTERTVGMLIDAGADLNLQNDEGWSTLIFACWSGNYGTEKTVRMLIDAGADLDLIDEDNENALSIAVMFCGTTSSTETINMLIEAIY